MEPCPYTWTLGEMSQAHAGVWEESRTYSELQQCPTSTEQEISINENAWMVPRKCIICNTTKEGKKRQLKLSLPVLPWEQERSFIFSMENTLHK